MGCGASNSAQNVVADCHTLDKMSPEVSEKGSTLKERNGYTSGNENGGTRGQREISSGKSRLTVDSGISADEGAEFQNIDTTKEKASEENNKQAKQLKNKEQEDLQMIARPPTRSGNLAFDVLLYPNTGNVRKRPDRLATLEMRSKQRRRHKGSRKISPADAE